MHVVAELGQQETSWCLRLGKVSVRLTPDVELARVHGPDKPVPHAGLDWQTLHITFCISSGPKGRQRVSSLSFKSQLMSRADPGCLPAAVRASPEDGTVVAVLPRTAALE